MIQQVDLFVSANPDYDFLELGSLPLTNRIDICITMKMIGNLFERVFLYLSMSQIRAKTTNNKSCSTLKVLY